MNQDKEKKSSETYNKLCEQIEKKINELTTAGIQQTNIDYVGKLIDIKKDISEMKGMEANNMMYRGYDNYGAYDNYDAYNGGRRRDMQGRFMEAGRGQYGRRYRGHDTIDDMADYYGTYMETKENGRYGSPEMNKALDYMLQSVEEFMGMLKQDASSQEEVEKIKRTARKISEM